MNNEHDGPPADGCVPDAIHSLAQENRDVLESILGTHSILADRLERELNNRFDRLTGIVKKHERLLAASIDDAKEANDNEQMLLRKELKSSARDYESEIKSLQRHMNSLVLTLQSHLESVRKTLLQVEEFATETERARSYVQAMAQDIDSLIPQIQKISPHLLKSKDDIWTKVIVPLTQNSKSQLTAYQLAIDTIANNAYQKIESLAAKLKSVDDGLDDAAQRFADRLLSLLLRPEHVARIVHQAATCSFPEADGVRTDVVEKLPELADMVETELRYWRAVADPTINPARVVRTLENIIYGVFNWMNIRGIERFGEPGDTYDYAMHIQDSGVDAQDSSLFGKIKEVAYSGYRLRQGNKVLRRAKVVVWEKPRDDSSPELSSRVESTHSPE